MARMPVLSHGSFLQVPADEPGYMPIARPKIRIRSMARYVALVAVGCAALFGVHSYSRRPCVPLADADAATLQTFFESDPLSLNVKPGDEDATVRWLEQANVAADANEIPLPSGKDWKKFTKIDLSKALKSDNPAEVAKIAKHALSSAAAGTRSKREQLKKFLDANNKRSLKKKGGGKSPQQKVYTAKCVFDSLQATNSFAFIAANVNDALRTCAGEHIQNLLAKNNTRGKVCAINLAFAFGEIANLAAMLSLAANDCAATLLPNVDALCAAAVSGLAYGIAEMAAGGALIASSCNNRWMGANLPESATPSNVGQLPAFAGVERRLVEEEDEIEEPAPERKLLFGGGKGSIATQCALQISGVVWSLAQGALWITQAAEGSIGPLGKCPPQNLFGGNKIKGPIYRDSQAFCAQNVGGILVAYAQIIAFIQFAVVDCADVLNLKAVCGAGVTAVAGSFAAIAQTGPAMNLACDVLQDPLMKKAINAATKLDQVTGNTLSKILGRRLETEEDPLNLDDIKSRFASPEDAFKSIGYDLDDPNAEFKKVRPPMHKVDKFVSELVERDSFANGLFGSSTCPV